MKDLRVERLKIGARDDENNECRTADATLGFLCDGCRSGGVFGMGPAVVGSIEFDVTGANGDGGGGLGANASIHTEELSDFGMVSVFV